MTRSLPEWIAKHDDETIPDRVELRIYTKANGLCQKCGRQLRRGHWAVDHVIALANGGRHAESNLQALCNVPCHSDKTKSDVAEKSAVYQSRLRDLGIKRKPKGRPLMGTKASGWKKKINGQVERRT